MKLVISVAAAAALACTACTDGGHGGGGLTQAECKQLYVKGFQLQGMPESVYSEMLDLASQGCAEADAVSRRDFECAMDASTLKQYEDCHVVFDLR
ncbi:MAG TPA: hypothetical protein VFG21_10435 [Xanthomonadaceae bacterium]|nr:hypothetical protein [Xanthomonadaceae bacterium]